MSGFATQLTTRPLLLKRLFATVFFTLLLAAICVLSIIPSHAVPTGSESNQEGGAHGPVVTQTVTATPSATQTAAPNGPTFYDRKSLINAADKYAIEVKGMEDVNKNGIPDYREYYVVNYHDCAEHSATFDWLLEEMAKDGRINYEQGMGASQIRGSGHAANLVPGLGEVDVTPVMINGRATASNGTPWHSWRQGYTPYKQGYPDAGEFTFKGYNGPRARTIPGTPVPGTAGLGGGGGLLGGGSGGGFIGTLSQLMQRNGGGGSSGGGALGSGSKSTLPQSSGAKSPTKPPTNATAPKTPAPVVVKPSPSAAPAPKAPVAAPPVPPVTSPAPQPPKGGLAMEIPSDKPGSSSVAPSGPSSIVPATEPANAGFGGASPGSSGVPSLGSLQKAAIDVFKENPSANSQPETTTRPSEMGAPVLKGASSTAGSDAMLDVKRPSAWDIPELSAVNGAADGTQNSKGFF